MPATKRTSPSSAGAVSVSAGGDRRHDDDGDDDQRQPKKRRKDDGRDEGEESSSSPKNGTSDDDAAGSAAAGGPIEDEGTAREKLRRSGFDPDKLSRGGAGAGVGAGSSVTPVNYFCIAGDLKMCRYLLARCGAGDCWSEADGDGGGATFPMMTAAINHRLDVCKWLYEHTSANRDIRRRNGDGYSALGISLVRSVAKFRGNLDTCKWLILKGALCLDDGGEAARDGGGGRIDEAAMRKDLMPLHAALDTRPELLAWAREAVRAHGDFRAFLAGTTILAPPLPAAATAAAAASGELAKPPPALGGFSGQPGILELIAEYAGVPRGRDLRILRQLADRLPSFIQDTPAPRVREYSDVEEDDYFSDDENSEGSGDEGYISSEEDSSSSGED